MHGVSGAGNKNSEVIQKLASLKEQIDMEVNKLKLELSDIVFNKYEEMYKLNAPTEPCPSDYNNEALFNEDYNNYKNKLADYEKYVAEKEAEFKEETDAIKAKIDKLLSLGTEMKAMLNFS